jgi:hypothetical protein
MEGDIDFGRFRTENNMQAGEGGAGLDFMAP